MNFRTKTKDFRIYRLKPDNFSSNVWGGQWIARWKGTKTSLKNVGEAWDFSLHPNLPSQIQIKGRWRPITRRVKKSPFLIKFIDAADNLSLQVHPDDTYARRHDRDSGKAESWIVLPSTRGSIYLGFRKSVKKGLQPSQLKQEFGRALREGASRGRLLSFLNKIKVKPGDVFYLPPGTVHAIGAGVRLFEIQQTSNVTYRVWDWNRKIKRPLHLDQAMDVIDFRPKTVEQFKPKAKKISEQGWGHFSTKQILVDEQKRFAVQEIALSKGSAVLQNVRTSFAVYTVASGRVEIEGWGSVQTGHSVLALKAQKFEMKAIEGSARVFKSFSPA